MRSARTSRAWRVHRLWALIVLLIGMWLSTGTMAPYAATLSFAIVTTPCHYLVNSDHGHFKAVFLMLDGAARQRWEWSVYLRRILHPLIAYPLMKAFGFEWGGVLCNFALQVAAFVGFAHFLRRTSGELTGILGMWLLALYPGIHYWVGLPYAHATIVPCSLVGMIILWHANQESSSVRIALSCLMMGMLFLAYDLFPFFGLATVLILLARSRWMLVPVAVLLLAAPAVAWNAILRGKFHIHFVNSSTAVYPTILQSYLKIPNFRQWADLLRAFPTVTYENYFFSNFLFLPALFLLLVLVRVILGRNRFSVPEIALLVSGLLLYLFLNLAPPYEGWQMRGLWMPRLHQPVFVALLTFSARGLASLWSDRQKALRAVAVGLCAITLLGNSAIVFGPALHSHFSSTIYQRFYKHSPPDTLYVSLARYGRRPLGVCDSSLPPVEKGHVQW